MASTYGITTAAVQVLGTEQSARITNSAASGNLFLGPATITSAGTNAVYTVAAGGVLGPVNGPLWAVGSVAVPVMVEEVVTPPLPVTASETRFWGGGISPLKAAAAGGTNTAGVANRAWIVSVYIPNRCTLTGAAYLVGTTGGSDLSISALYDANGKVLANSALAGATVGTANGYDSRDFTTPYRVQVPGRYFLAVITNGTTATLQIQDGSAGASGATSVIGGTQASAAVFGTSIANVTAPTAVGSFPIMFTY